MSIHGVKELNKVQCSKSIRDALTSAVVAVCHQVFSFSSCVRIDGRISFIIDDLQIISITLSETAGHQIGSNHIMGSVTHVEKLSSNQQFDKGLLSQATQNKNLTEVSSDEKLQYSLTSMRKLLSKESVKDTETFKEINTFETHQSLLSSHLPDEHVENAVCDSISAISMDNSSNVSEAHKDISCNPTHHIDYYQSHISQSHSDIDKLPEKGIQCGMHGQHDVPKSNLENLDVIMYPCMFCDKNFQAATTLGKHLRNHHKEQQKRSCNFCRLRFSTAKLLQQHIESKHQFRCTICSAVFTSNRLLYEHFNHLHTENNLSCVVCNRLFATRGSLQRHMIVHSEISRPRVSCDKCDKSFTSSSTLYHHKRAIHGNEKPYRCHECGEQFNFNHSLKLHLLKHAGSRPHQCNMCGKSYLTASHLKYHIGAIHSIKKCVCNFCGKSFPYETSLKLHKMVHSGDRPFTCSTCGKRYITRGALREHEETHNGNLDDLRKYRCEVCSQLYRTAALLRAHSRRHTSDAARHVCEVCGRTFMYRSNLDAHATVHSGERAFTCKICGKKFKTSATLYSHRIIHRTDLVADYVCTTCGKPFKTKERLKAHEARHSGTKLFKCRICGGDFPDRGGLNKHLKTVHCSIPRFACPVCGKTANRLDNLRVHMRTHNNASLLTMTAAELASELGSMGKHATGIVPTCDNKTHSSLSSVTSAQNQLSISNTVESVSQLQVAETSQEVDADISCLYGIIS